MLTKEAKVVTILNATAIELIEGEAAWVVLSSESFLTEWDRIYKACPWATIFQSRAFVVTWYQTYREKYVPIIVKAEYGGKLTGLLTLAVPVAANGKSHIVGAGQFEAEYHAWLTEPADGESFIKGALHKVQQQYPKLPIHLRFLPPDTPLQWMNEPYWQKRCVLQSAKRPLMDMSDPAMDKMFRKKEFVNKLNRLKKLGKLDFERVTSKEQFAAALDELKVVYDFRRGAMFNKNLFAEEPLKAAFLLALFEQDLLHVTTLKVNGQIFAAVAATTRQDWVHLCGINVHIPFQSKFYSPGFVNFLLLAQLLVKEGVKVFDLTPGGDFYKERMATRHDQVNELMVTNSFVYAIKRKLRRRVYAYLAKTGRWPMGTELALKKRIYLFKARIRQSRKKGLLKSLIGKIQDLIHTPKDKIYVAPVDNFRNKMALPINRNSLSDLLCFEAEGTMKSRWEFLEEAMHRFEVGDTSFTYCEDGRLLACVWWENSANSFLGEEGKSNTVPLNGKPLLKDLYSHPLGLDNLESFIETVIDTVVKDGNTDQVYTIISSQDKTQCQTLENIGFKKVDKMEMRSY